jgi:4-hydroxythreonine-4-phosphate dehydrogenase
VCGINPHAGENGLFGNGEEARIVPAVTAVVADGVDAVGPLPADAALFRAVRGYSVSGSRPDQPDASMAR